jgi:hypothetical protein
MQRNQATEQEKTLFLTAWEKAFRLR